MNIEVDLKESAINDAIAKAVVESRLGKALEERISQFLNDTSGYGRVSFSDEMQRAVDAELRSIVMQFVHAEYGERIKAKARELLTDEVVGELCNKAFEAFQRKY